MAQYDLQRAIADLSSLVVGANYSYASTSGHAGGTCSLVSVDSNTGAIKFTRNGNNTVENISSNAVNKLVLALNSRKAVEVNSLYGGSGNFRSVIEALFANTSEIYVCKSSGKKCIFWDEGKVHPIGQIVVAPSPSQGEYAAAQHTVPAIDNLGLKIGMRSEYSNNGVVTILDDDCYSYQVLCKNDSKHSIGIRTISKLIVKEWIDYIKSHPNASSADARDALTGHSDIDKFEYGNFGPLHKIAKMAVGAINHSIVDVSQYWNRRMGTLPKDEDSGSSDSLSVALKLFAERRKWVDWCTDNTDGDTTKPRTGYVANKKLRAALPMTNNLGTDAQVVQWFKDYTYPDGKSWLDGIDTDGCAAFGGYVNYLVTGGTAVARPEKFTKSLESAVKAIAKPESECFYNKDIHSVLKDLGLLGFEFKEDFDEDDYQDALHAQRVIKRRLKDMGEKQVVEWDAAANQAKPNDKAPDFLTVNEFLWFVFDEENRKEISRIAKEKAMAKQQKKPTKDKVTTGTATISGLLANKEDSLMTMLTAALLTKPLVILAGVSGTGKSRMVRHLAYKTCLDKDLQPQGGNAPGNFKMIQVKPNWHDSADLLGYRSVVSGNHEFVTTEFVKFVLKAHAYPDTPFFVCLDEMNLAPVEHYFAEFLSACESIRKNEQGVWISDPIVSPTDFDGEIVNLGGDVKFESDDATLDAALKARKALIEKEGLFIPRNLFVVGTVNMDDTTNGFSRKVLDRAMTIEMNEVKFDELQKKDEGLSVAVANVFTPTEIKKFIDRADFDGQAMLNDEFRDQMEALRGKLEKSPFALAYRFARETTLYRKALMTILNPAEVVKDASGAPKKDAASTPIDAERACGEIALDHMILMKVLPRFTGTVTERETIIKDVGEYLDALIKDKKVGKVKLDDMVERAKHNGGYLSFWP